jgi:serine O-acetyltransferase
MGFALASRRSGASLEWRRMAATEQITPQTLMRDVRKRHPRFVEAVIADASVTAEHRGERHEFRGIADAWLQIARLSWSSDAFFAQVLYRAKARLQALGVPLVPRIFHKLAMQLGQVAIGDPVVIQPGLYLLHGQVVIDGLTEIDSRARIAPFVVIGLRNGDIVGPRIGRDVDIGTGAKVLGRIEVGDDASIGANAVVIHDVAAGDTVAGAPARPV